MIKFFLVFFTVLLEVLSALIVDHASSLGETLTLMAGVLIGLAFLVNALKFVGWGVIHKRFDLSKSYPITAVFFPLIYGVALFKGEAEIEFAKIIGIIFIIIGVILIQKKVNNKKINI